MSTERGSLKISSCPLLGVSEKVLVSAGMSTSWGFDTNPLSSNRGRCHLKAVHSSGTGCSAFQNQCPFYGVYFRQARQAQEKRQKELNEEYKQNQAMKIQNQSAKPKQLVCPKCKRAVNISAIPRDNNPSGLCRMCLYNLPRR